MANIFIVICQQWRRDTRADDLHRCLLTIPGE